MAREKKHAAPEAAAEPKVEKPLAQLILNQTHSKYAIVELASAHASELHRREENRHLTQVELLDLALTEVLTNKVSPEEIKEKAAAAALVAAAQAANTKEKK